AGLRRRHPPPSAARAARAELAMSGHGRPEPGAGPTVEGYLAEVAARLPGPGRAQAGIAAELRSGLLDATDAHCSAGLPLAEAAQAAIREFGDPALVADGFRAEIAASQARRVAIALLVTGPLVGLLWIATAATSHLAIPLAPPWHWTGPSSGLPVGIDLVAVAAGVTAWAALLGIATTGRLTRWLPTRPRPGPPPASSQPRPAHARQARRTPLPGHPREPDLIATTARSAAPEAFNHWCTCPGIRRSPGLWPGDSPQPAAAGSCQPMARHERQPVGRGGRLPRHRRQLAWFRNQHLERASSSG